MITYKRKQHKFMRRVVVTGTGLVTPLACGVKPTWSRLLASQSGIRRIKSFDTTDYAVKIGGEVPLPTSGDSDAFDVNVEVDIKLQGRVDTFILYGLSAARQAVEDSGWKPEGGCDRTGVLLGSGIGGLQRISETTLLLAEKGPRRVSPFFIPASLINLLSGQVSIQYGYRGPNHAVVTACSTGSHAIGDAMRLIQYGDADVMVAGSAEAALCPVGLAGFIACKALSTQFNDQPEAASRPWDEKRDGFVMGEGAGVVVLEELEHAKKRGAHIYAEVVGYGLSGDAHHMTAPPEDANGAYRAMKAAVERAGCEVEDIGYVNAHGTSTPLGDGAEVIAVKRLFGDHAYRIGMSSTKSSIGHLLGAAGSVEAIFSVLALRDQVMPATLNLDHPSPGCDLNFVPHTPQESKFTYVMSNSFGFGGTNASLIFKRF